MKQSGKPRVPGSLHLAALPLAAGRSAPPGPWPASAAPPGLATSAGLFAPAASGQQRWQMLGAVRVTGTQIIAKGPITIFYFGNFFLFPNKFSVLLEQLKNCFGTK